MSKSNYYWCVKASYVMGVRRHVWRLFMKVRVGGQRHEHVWGMQGQDPFQPERHKHIHLPQGRACLTWCTYYLNPLPNKDCHESCASLCSQPQCSAQLSHTHWQDWWAIFGHAFVRHPFAPPSPTRSFDWVGFSPYQVECSCLAWKQWLLWGYA